jgi:serine/threonine protein phosphatase PrpC
VIVVRSAGKTDPGRKRRRNEDSFVCDPPLFAVADGMGGAQAGEVASRLAASALREGNGDGDAEQRVIDLIQEANRRVWQRANEDAAASGMGTTITVALVEPDGRVLFGHVGDSRAYVLRGEQLEQLTEDHSLVAELVRRGELSPQEAVTHPQRSVITRALGTDPDVDVDTFAVQAVPGDVFLICSDGLSSMVDDETVGSVIARNRGDLDATARALVAEANRGGGDDNITAVLFELADGADDEDATRAMPAVAAEPEPAADDDEDTLSGIEAVPAAVDTMVVPPAEARQLFAPDASARPSLARRLLAILVIVTLVLVIAALVLWGLAR